MFIDFLLGVVAGLILVVLIMAVSKVSQLNDNLENLSKTVLEIQQSLGRPNGGDPDWPDFNAAGVMEQMPPPAKDHKTIADVLRGVYCGNAYTVQLLNRRLK